MPPRKAAAPKEGAPKWTPDELMAVRHLGPGIIGQEKYDALQAHLKTTSGGRFGPAITSNDPKYNQAGPVLARTEG